MSDFKIFLRSVMQQWSRLLTGSMIVALVGLLYGTGNIPIPKVVFWLLIIATFLRAFFLAWSSEHRRAERLKELVIREYQGHVRAHRGKLPTHLVYESSDQEERAYLEQIDGDPELIREAVRRCRQGRQTIPKI